MDFRSKYDCMIDTIEENIHCDNNIICEELHEELYLDKRTINEVFNFISNFTINDYIGRRKLNHIYENKMQSGDSWDSISYEYGFNDYSSFSRKFKKKIGISPKEAEERSRDDMTKLFTPPLYIDEILKGGDLGIKKHTKEDVSSNLTVLDTGTYKAFEEMLEYKTRYGFTDNEVLNIYKLNLETGVNLEILSECLIFEKDEEYEACEDWLIECYRINKICEDDVLLVEDEIKLTKKVCNDFDLDFVETYIYVRCGFEYEMFYLMKEYQVYAYEAYEFRRKITNEGFSWSDIDKRYIDLYLGNSDVTISYSEFREMIKAIEQLGLKALGVSDLFSIYINYEYAESWEEAAQCFIEEMNSVDNDDYCDHIEEFLDMRASERGDKC